MRIGPQLHGFAGFELPTNTTVSPPVPSVTPKALTFHSVDPPAESEQTNGLAIALPDPNDPASMAVPNDPEKLTKAQVTGLIYQRLAENLVVNTSPSIEQLLRLNLSLFKSNVDLQG